MGRLLDANLNRFKEGVRVVEDTLRYLHNNEDLALRLKQIRHQATLIFTRYGIDFLWLYTQRDSLNDVLSLHDNPPKEPSSLNMLQANFKRAQESARVLEECFKYLMPQKPQDPSFKTLRYSLYTLEKECMVFLNDLPKNSFFSVE
ncbi:thiamine-phosphate pyrophosphorylase [Helicobacter ailurogastricus]|uniref:thiamine-phosphate pyrophosphorylase n=1 Tax=Helicobacter ailurogastricus TaxID=1578720 RepID=UPI000CF14B0C|nr:thiamine-phosphate pyrophosphorylase [Helicobacter ailurogastricus]